MSTRTVPGRSHLVLLADADPDTRMMYAEALQDQGIDVITVSGVQQVIVFAPQAKIIVMELLLPRYLDGIRLLERLKREAETREIPVVVLTACVWPNECARAHQAGCDRFLAKPCLPDDLARELRGLLAPIAGSSVESPEDHCRLS